MASVKVTIPAAGGRKEFSLFGELTNMNYFLKTPVTADASQGPSVKQVTVKPHTRRRYPGDPAPINVSGAQREFLVDPTRRSGSGLPGRTITLVSDYGLPNEERRSFTLYGNWVDFHAWLIGKAKYALRAYNNSGAWSSIDATGTP
jgi:hypothetical protein